MPAATKPNKSTDSKSLFRDVLRGAITAKLKKNELVMVLALLERTLGYGKAADANTDSRLEKEIEGTIRRDHMKIALNGVIKAGIFDREKDPKYQWKYSIGKKFLNNFDGIFFTPTLPKLGNSLPKQDFFPETWGHTALDLNSSLSLQIQQRSPIINISTKPTIFPIATQEEQSSCSRNLKDKKPAKPEPLWKPQWDWDTEGLEVPASISQSNHRFCKNNLLKATAQQARDALTVYNNMWTKGNVSNPPFLLKSLIERAMSDNLVLPQSNTIAKIRIPNVPTTLDDSLVTYARENGFSEPKRDAGYDYLAYRKDLVQEREVKLKALNQKASQPASPAETKTAAAPQTAMPAQTTKKPHKTNIDRLNDMSDQALETGRTIQDIAFETNQRFVLKELGIPLERDEPELPAKPEENQAPANTNTIADEYMSKILAMFGDE